MDKLPKLKNTDGGDQLTGWWLAVHYIGNAPNVILLAGLQFLLSLVMVRWEKKRSWSDSEMQAGTFFK